MNLLGRAFSSDQAAAGGGGGNRLAEDRDRLEHRPRGLRLAVRAPIEDADPDAVVIRRRHTLPAQLEVDRLLLVAHPFVGSNCFEAGEDQPRVDDQRGHLRGHLRHHRERQNRQSQQRRIEGRDLAAPQRVVLRDRIVVRFEYEQRLDLGPGTSRRTSPAQGPAARGRTSWRRIRCRRRSMREESLRTLPCESHRQSASLDRCAEIGRHDLLLSLQERLHRVLETTAWRRSSAEDCVETRSPVFVFDPGRSMPRAVGSRISRRRRVAECGRAWTRSCATAAHAVIVREPVAVVMRVLCDRSDRRMPVRSDGFGDSFRGAVRVGRARCRSRSTSSSESRISGKPIFSSTRGPGCWFRRVPVDRAGPPSRVEIIGR